MTSAIQPLDETLNRLNQFLTNLLDVKDHQLQTISFIDWMKVYGLVYNICVSSSGGSGVITGPGYGGSSCQQLYQFTQKFIEAWVHKAASTVQTSSDFNKLWLHYSQTFARVNHIYAYFNRNWIKRQNDANQAGTPPQVHELYSLALIVFRNLCVKQSVQSLQPTPQPSIRQTLVTDCLDIIEAYRRGQPVDRLLYTLLTCYHDLSGLAGAPPADIYLELEKVLLQATQTHYQREAVEVQVGQGHSSYLSYVTKKLVSEKALWEPAYDSWTRVQPLLVATLISEHQSYLLDQWMGYLEEDRRHEIKMTYDLLKLLPEGTSLPQPVWTQWLKSDVDRALKGLGVEPMATAYIDCLISRLTHFNTLVDECMGGQAEFKALIDKTAKTFVNQNCVSAVKRGQGSSTPQSLSTYFDSLLKKSATDKTADESRVEESLSSLMNIFKYLDDKDVFLNLYQRNLTKRLLFSSSKSEDLERTMIAKLREDSGYSYTHKLQKMFTDITLSVDLNRDFQESGSKLPFDLSVNVLTTGCWSVKGESETSLVYPSVISGGVEAFTKFYEKRNHGRKLAWLPYLSRGELRMDAGRKYTLMCSSYQMFILLAFNQSSQQTVADLVTVTGISQPLLQDNIKLLVKLGLLTEDKCKTSYTVSKGFKPPKGRLKMNINVPLDRKKAEKDEKVENDREVQEGRKILIQAAIVRIMKMRKAYEHNNLVSEVVVQLSNKFSPTIPMIKQCVSMLIEKEYLERNGTGYKYLA